MAKQPTLDDMRLALTKVLPRSQRNANLKKFLSPSKVKEKLYHATPKDFKEFQGEGFDPTISGNATWLSTDPKHQPAMHNISGGRDAKFREGTNVMPVHVQAKVPLYLDDKGMIEYARAAYAKGHSEFPDLLTPETVRLLKEDGYDSIIHADPYKVGRPHEIIMLEPKRIKSAIGNRGTYDPNDPDITKAKGGEVMPHHQREANKAKFLESSHIKKVLYHGTSKDIKQFKPSRMGALGPGTYLSEHPSEASGYAGINREGDNHPNVMPLHVQATNPFVISHVNKSHDELFKHFDPEGKLSDDEVIKRVIASGHDSIYAKDSGEINMLDRRKIKSAIGNRGTYDVNDPDITKAKGGSVEPKKTVKAYKLFRVHEKHPGKLFPLFVDANTPVEMGKWIDAKEGEMANGKVKSKIGNLAFRPGWHAGDVPVATHIGEKSDPSLTAPDTRPENHAWAEVEMPNDVDWQSEANRRGMNAQGKLIPVKAHITDQLPVGGHYRYKTNPNMTGNWLIGGSMKVNKILTDAEVAKINKAHGLADLPRAQKFNKKRFGFAKGGVVAPEAWVAEEHVNHGAQHGGIVPQPIESHLGNRDVPSMQSWIRNKKHHGGITHAHHLEIEERPL